MDNIECNNCPCNNEEPTPDIPSGMWEELKKRWNSESPKFWKKIMNIAIAVGSSAVAVIASDKLFDLQAYGIDPIIFNIAGYIVVACAALGLSAKITTQ